MKGAERDDAEGERGNEDDRDRQSQDYSRDMRDDAEFAEPADAEFDEKIDKETGQESREQAKPQDGEEPENHQSLRHEVSPVRNSAEPHSWEKHFPRSHP